MDPDLTKNDEIKNRNFLLSNTAIETLQKTSPWTKFISIIGLIFGGLMIVAAFYFLVSKNLSSYSGSTMCITYLIFGFVCLRINLLLFNYSSEIKEINYNGSLENAFKMQHKFWKYNGILVIIYFSFLVIALLAFIIQDLMI